MTDNHLLLYRLAELMLEHEQHVLPVDLLFDDEQIGDFVKIIQIDSPYQQMLFEGVLTETVRDEKLYVSFTVEGYFHYLLGEVIDQLTNEHEPKALLDLLVYNQLNGIREGLEQCLIRDVQNNDLSRLMWLIDSKGETNDISALPLAYSFSSFRGSIKSQEEYQEAIDLQINKVLNELLLNPTTEDINALTESLQILEKVQKNQIVTLLYKQINERIKPNLLNKAVLFLKTIQHIHHSQRKNNLDRVIKLSINEETELVSDFYHEIAEQFGFISEYDKAIEYYEKSLAIDLKVHGDQHSSAWESYNNLGIVWSKKGEYDKAKECYEKSLAINLKVHGNQHHSTGLSYNNLAIVWYEKCEYDKAIEYYEKSLAIRLKVHGDQHPSAGESYNNLGIVWKNKGEYDKAIEYYEKSLAINLKVHGDQHPSIGRSYNNLGEVWYEKGEYDKAIEYYEKSLAIRLKVHGDQHPYTGESYNNLGEVWYEKCEYDKAIEYYEKSLAIDLKVHGDQHLHTGMLYDNLGVVWYEKGEYNKAIEYYEKSLAIDLKVHGDQHPSTGSSFYSLGEVWEEKGEYEKAKKCYEKSHSIFLNSLDEDHPHIKHVQGKLNSLNDH